MEECKHRWYVSRDSEYLICEECEKVVEAIKYVTQIDSKNTDLQQQLITAQEENARLRTVVEMLIADNTCDCVHVEQAQEALKLTTITNKCSVPTITGEQARRLLNQLGPK
jgi:DNA-binding SARP family transcriptional activator